MQKYVWWLNLRKRLASSSRNLSIYVAEFAQSLLLAGKQQLEPGSIARTGTSMMYYLGLMYPNWTWAQRHDREQYFCFLLRCNTVDREGLSAQTSIYDQRDDFIFHTTNIPLRRSIIPFSLVFAVLTSQLIRYARACSLYECFILRTRRFSCKLFKQEYLLECLKS